MTSPYLRRKSREYLVQALYQWQIANAPTQDILAEFMVDHSPKKFDVAYFQELFQGIIQSLATLDENLIKHIDRRIEEVDPVELSILRLATYELLFRIDIPYRVVINEAIEQTKRFGATDAHKFVNGVLDKLAQEIRSDELNQPKRK